MDDRAPFASAVDRLAQSIEKLDERMVEDRKAREEGMLALRARIHEVHGAVIAVEKIMERSSVILERTARDNDDHESRIRHLEMLGPEGLIRENDEEHARLDGRLADVERSLRKIDTKLARWGGFGAAAGAVFGAVVGPIIAKLIH